MTICSASAGHSRCRYRVQIPREFSLICLFFYYMQMWIPHSFHTEQSEHAVSGLTVPNSTVPDQLSCQGVNTVVATCRTPPLNCIGSSAVLNQ